MDAGYVIVAGGELCCGTGDRHRLDLDVAQLRDHLNQIAAESTGLSALRMYWYDAAPYAGPTEHHNEIARLPNVKLRLGRIKSGKQKRLREGVRTIQGLGVRVTLIGIPPRHQATNQSLELIQEADECVILTKDVLTGFFRLRSVHARMPISEDTDTALSARTLSGTDIAREAGADLAETIRRSPEYGSILSSRPRIPQEVDRQLLRSLRQQLKTQDVPDRLRHDARTSFWKTLSTTNRPSAR